MIARDGDRFRPTATRLAGAMRTLMLGCMYICIVSVVRGETADSGVAVIRLRPTMAASGPVITLADLADVSGGNAELRQRLLELDVADAKPGSEITNRQIDIRLRLAGFQADEYVLAGASSVTGQTVPADRTADVLQTIRQELAKNFSVEPDELDVRLTQGSESLQTRPSATRYEVFVPPGVKPGTVRLRVGWYRQEQFLQATPVMVEATIRSADRTASTFERERAPSRSPVRNPVSATVRQDEFIVQSRDVVRVVARKGKLRVTASQAEALQRGRLGDTIRIRNLITQRIIVGKVISADEVQVSF